MASKRLGIILACLLLLSGVVGYSQLAHIDGTSASVTITGDVTDSSGANTFTDCTGLSFPVTSGNTYRFEAIIFYTSAISTTGSGWAISGPTATSVAVASFIPTGSGTNQYAMVNDYNLPAAATATSPTLGNGIALLYGVVNVSATGTIQVRFETEIDTSAVVCKAGSTITYW